MHVHVHVNKWTTTASTLLYIGMQQCDIMYLIVYFDANNHCVFTSLKNQGVTLLLGPEYLYVILLFFFSFFFFFISLKDLSISSTTIDLSQGLYRSSSRMCLPPTEQLVLGPLRALKQTISFCTGCHAGRYMGCGIREEQEWLEIMKQFWYIED